MSIAKDKDPSIRIKMHQTFFLCSPLFTLYLLSRCDLFDITSFSLISLMASLDILHSNPLNVKNKITKIEHKKIFCGSSTQSKILGSGTTALVISNEKMVLKLVRIFNTASFLNHFELQKFIKRTYI